MIIKDIHIEVPTIITQKLVVEMQNSQISLKRLHPLLELTFKQPRVWSGLVKSLKTITINNK